MGKDNRVTLRRRHSYSTKSNKTKMVKTPGGKFVVQYRKKHRSGPSCGDCGGKIQGIPAVAPKTFKSLNKKARRVNRAYGVRCCHNCVHKRIVRSFLCEESRIMLQQARQK